jgi:hypothetical protein
MVGRVGLALLLLCAGCGSSNVAPSSSTPPASTHHKTTHHKKTVHHKKRVHHKTAGHGRLCIGPGAGSVHIVTSLAPGVSFDNWAAACAANGGYPVQRLGPTHFLEPRTASYYKVKSSTAGGWLVVRWSP